MLGLALSFPALAADAGLASVAAAVEPDESVARRVLWFALWPSYERQLLPSLTDALGALSKPPVADGANEEAAQHNSALAVTP